MNCDLCRLVALYRERHFAKLRLANLNSHRNIGFSVPLRFALTTGGTRQSPRKAKDLASLDVHEVYAVKKAR